MHAKCQGEMKPSYVIFQDDDIMLDVENFNLFLKHDPMPHMACLAHYSELLCFGAVLLTFYSSDDGFERVKRFSKYNLTFEAWESGHYYPKFCSGPATGVTVDTASQIYQRAVNTLDLGLRLEDVLFTGVIRHTAGVAPPIDYSKVRPTKRIYN